MRAIIWLWRRALAGRSRSDIPFVEGGIIALGAGFLQQGVLHGGLLVGSAGVGVIALAIFLASIIGLGKTAVKWAVFWVFAFLLIGWISPFPMAFWQRALAVVIPSLLVYAAIQRLPRALHRAQAHKT